jgi:hypothetical protein
MNRIFEWLKKPDNAVILILLLIVTIYGIIDDNLEVLFMIYLIAFGIGLLWRLFYFISDKFKSKK